MSELPKQAEALSSTERDLPKLLREAERRVNAHVFKRGGDDSLASIPANIDRDVDLLLIEAADRLERLTRALRPFADAHHAATEFLTRCSDNHSVMERNCLYMWFAHRTLSESRFIEAARALGEAP